MAEFLLKRGSVQDRFLHRRTKIQIYGGAYGNGKSAGLVLKGLSLANDYPGSTGLFARATYPKLNDTLRKEFVKWCPPISIKSFPQGQNGSNICTFKNGTQAYFRYIAQQGKSSADQSTSNLLSATYDWAIIDQAEDPEITHKDFLDIMGRMRGGTPYRGDDPSMPRTGPRWVMLGVNPTSNWVFTKLVRPLQIYKASGVVTPDLLCLRDSSGEPIIKDGEVELLISLDEGSTYELRHVHESEGGDFISTLESMYQGQQRERFLLGKWAAYEGLVYPTFDTVHHGLQEENIAIILDELRSSGYEPTWIEGYDYGLTSPSVYGLAFVTPSQQVILCDGFYKKEYPIDEQAAHIKAIRERWQAFHTEFDNTYADPSIFGRKTVSAKTVGKTIAQMFAEQGIVFKRGNNDIANGITKVQGYLLPNRRITHPVTKTLEAPRFYYNTTLMWFNDEITSYYWKTNSSGDRIDVPVDRNDHAMDMLRYLLSKMPDVGKYFVKENERIPSWMQWNEDRSTNEQKSHRYR